MAFDHQLECDQIGSGAGTTAEALSVLLGASILLKVPLLVVTAVLKLGCKILETDVFLGFLARLYRATCGHDSGHTTGTSSTAAHRAQAAPRWQPSLPTIEEETVLSPPEQHPAPEKTAASAASNTAAGWDFLASLPARMAPLLWGTGSPRRLSVLGGDAHSSSSPPSR
mmetsp:Transcript_977/g.2426  ORF Transcript_977/g.2426 Transcript_977/m.2426 type:complete len:169 (+) Transcript_977:319-825(+)|eukprot:CAMPEP_0201216256 /NCGR_PEP_ID=MMETSP0851-20130426/189416_1 /ASSEMBLY_ACC=CAM_ASM_000631 /TAXON_ID=183588 /ORGANISM="Pseudo-nitzschia fraudulenta, Strain WWA7" /LENGTH=168 /DNA_ID=CAMNT_0047505805 /DNA_START=209 /DNA_END=715 /DNA_ORIENTATION=+